MSIGGASATEPNIFQSRGVDEQPMVLESYRLLPVPHALMAFARLLTALFSCDATISAVRLCMQPHKKYSPTSAPQVNREQQRTKSNTMATWK